MSLRASRQAKASSVLVWGTRHGFLGSRGVAQDPWQVSLCRRFRPFVPYHTPRAGFLAAPCFLLPASAAATVPTWMGVVISWRTTGVARDEWCSCVMESGGNLEAAGLWLWSGVGYNPSLPIPSSPLMGTDDLESIVPAQTDHGAHQHLRRRHCRSCRSLSSPPSSTQTSRSWTR